MTDTFLASAEAKGTLADILHRASRLQDIGSGMRLIGTVDFPHGLLDNVDGYRELDSRSAA